MKKVKTKSQTLNLALLMFILGTNVAWAQKSVGINSEKDLFRQEQTLKQMDNAPRNRLFEMNPQLQNFSQNEVGDTLLLDFFADKHYKAVVLQVSKSYDNITGITARVTNTDFGYCYISVAGHDVALSTELPQENAFFSIKKINEQNYLFEQTLSDVQLSEHDGACSPPIENNASNNACHSTLRAVTPTLSESNAAVTVDVLVVYSPAAKEVVAQNGSEIHTLIDQGLQRSNLVLSNSQTNVTLNLVHKQLVDYTEASNPNTDLSRLRNPEDGYADEVHALRTRYHADLVVLLLGETGSSVAGAGYVMSYEDGNAKSGFSVVRAKFIAASYTLIHEIGHNFGCGHHTDTDNTALYSYSHGYRGISTLGTKFSTVLTYENTTGMNYPRIPYFSDPNMSFEDTPIGSADANNAKTIRQTKSVIAAYADEAAFIDAFLQDITLSDGALSPAFNPVIYQYTVEVDNSVTSIDIQGIASSPHANVSGNVTAMPLAEGSNTMEITVKDGWYNYTKKYGITITRNSIITGIDETRAVSDNVVFYPNPAKAGYPVSCRMNLDIAELASLEIYDISGNLVQQTVVKGHTVAMTAPPAAGVYLYVLKTIDGRDYRLKMIVE
jgi:hypothetical protein